MPTLHELITDLTQPRHRQAGSTEMPNLDELTNDQLSKEHSRRRHLGTKTLDLSDNALESLMVQRRMIAGCRCNRHGTFADLAANSGGGGFLMCCRGCGKSVAACDCA